MPSPDPRGGGLATGTPRPRPGDRPCPPASRAPTALVAPPPLQTRAVGPAAGTHAHRDAPSAPRSGGARDPAARSPARRPAWIGTRSPPPTSRPAPALLPAPDGATRAP